jgi:primase-polymerase (primpol)-like protein
MTDRPVPLTVQPAGIPLILQQERRWVVWHYVWDEGRSKWTKPLYIATAPEIKASSTDKTQWRSFSEALTTYEDGKCDGIGFVLGDGW